MKTTGWMVAAVGICSASLALLPAQSARADDKPYFKFDVGVALPQDVAITSINGQSLPAAGTAASIIGPRVSSEDAALPVTLDRPKLNVETGVRFDLIGGYSFSKSFAVELEAGLLYNPINKVETSGTIDGIPFTDHSGPRRISLRWSDMSLCQVPVLANLVYTLPLDSRFKPFVGAGAGGVWSIFSSNEKSGSDFTFAFQGFAGVNYAVSDTVEVGVVYKFLGTLDHNFDGVETDPCYNNSILATLTYRF